MTDTAVVIPFGKYRGEPFDEVAVRDPEYVVWLRQQNWFVKKFQDLVAHMVNDRQAHR
jgi:uncharacterized protein (DUF3820 family)